jgi:hypothetical protein
MIKKLILMLALLQQPKPVVVVYTAPGCVPCKLAVADLQQVADVRINPNPPAWVTQVPTLAWQRDGRWVQHAPAHWKATTWRGEWPRVQELLKGAK